jgi:hypothetical protein
METKTCKIGRPCSLSHEKRKKIYEMWLNGYSYVEIARHFETYRQKARNAVITRTPTLEDFKKHDENRRIRQMAKKLNS